MSRREFMTQQVTSNGRPRAACVGMDEAASVFGWPAYYMPFLVRAGHLKPLGKPAQNARKWFVTVELEQRRRLVGQGRSHRGEAHP